ncbi:cutinase family protein [Mycobacterium intracellulare subsp. chimaera]|uniref:cutinase family protein n=1 Tax=Mycobacterium intracellulare TaxID=1767 RepID=UPI000909AFB9|nr:cutinase family protein [Mycobacterium intracellulare]APD84082.1 cutinase family protein [Mycobacterium intracellulare subsp. chimaera]
MGTLDGMIVRRIVRSFGPAVVIAASGMAASAVSGSLIPTAAAQCPDVQVVFARGTGEEPGVGPTGQAFVDALHQRVGDRSFDVYPVNYPATDQWDTGIDGIRDAGAHVVSMAHDCPNTKMVLGGYSQGAAVMGFVTSAAPRRRQPRLLSRALLSPDVANHVSSVVLFGMPNVRAMNFLGEPPVVIGPAYQDKTLKVCATEDPVCSDGMNFAAHNTYADDGSIIDKGVAFASSHLGLGGPAPAPAPAGGGFGS